MAFKISSFGNMPDGREVMCCTLSNSHGLEASMINLGGMWVSMKVPDRNGCPADVLLGYDTVEKYLANPGHMGAIVGRNANRIGGACLTIQGKEYRLAANDGANNLHSGPDFYRSRIWEFRTEETEEGSKVIFSLFSPDGDQGYPGNAHIQVSYLLTEDNSLKLEYQMDSDKDTIANFTNHAYFNLAGHDSGLVLDQEVWINASFYTPADAGSIPTGEILKVQGTPMDFTSMKPIGRDIDQPFQALILGHGYDHNWVLDHPAGRLALAARAKDPKSGRTMECWTDLPGMQFYTGNFLDGSVAGKDGAHYGSRSGFCFETQYYPDAVHHTHFPSPILQAGEMYNTCTIYKFGAE